MIRIGSLAARAVRKHENTVYRRPNVSQTRPNKIYTSRLWFRQFSTPSASQPIENDLNTAPKACCSKKAKVDPVPQTQPQAEIARPHQHQMQSMSVSALGLQFWRDTSVWKVAATNTFRCLVGCSIGDFGMLFYLNSFFPGIGMMPIMAISMASGIATSVSLETVVLKYQQKLSWKDSFSMAVGMSMISMLTMEFVESLVDLGMYGGGVNLSDPFWWTALGISLLAGFLSPLPYNYYRLKKHNKSCH